MRKNVFLNTCAALATLFIAACKKAPAPDSGFLANPERMTEQRGRAPFDRAWVKPGFSKSQYTALIISKVGGKSTCVAIEGRLRDSVTGETLMMFADREEPPFRIISAKAVTGYGDAEDSIKAWANQLVELGNPPKDFEVKDAPKFTLNPW